MTHRSTRSTALLWLAMALGPGPAHGAAQVIEGPTPIPDGEAGAAGDLTVMNERLAFGIAVESTVPYGVPRGAIVDIAPVTNGKAGRDCVVFADFVPNNWSAWPNTHHKVEVLEHGPAQVVVKSTRDWGKVTIATTYVLRSNADRIEISTTMTNTGSDTLTGLLSGQTLWPSAGYFFGVPGLGDLQEGESRGAMSDRVVAYDENWAVALHAPYLDYVGSRSKDLFLRHTLKPGESHTLVSWLQVAPRGDMTPVLAAEIERTRVASGFVRGAVFSRNGKVVDEPVIVITRQGTPYAWSFGRSGKYEVPLPAGDYELYATAKGYSQSKPVPVRVAAGAAAAQDFRDVEPPGRVEFTVIDARNGKGLDARFEITHGQRQAVEFLGRNTFFTELDRKGLLEVDLAPGEYEFAVTAGGGFLAQGESAKLEVRPGQVSQAKAAITPLFDPPAAGWYAADLHHHADQAEGVTPPEFLARSQLAAGLDLLFVSDHDSTANHVPLQKIADRREIPFIPSVELSPSWGHFNAWPLQPGQRLAIDTSTANIDQVLGEARRLGAMVVASNHPFIPYGYLASLAAGVAPGGFNPGFDLLEMNADVGSFDRKVLQTLWASWNAGHRYYLTAGTDVHDVWNHLSGEVRMFAHVEGAPTARNYAEAVKAGHGYVSYGPLLFPGVMFGSDLKVRHGASFALPFELKSVAGLKQATLIGAGTLVETKTFTGAPREASTEFRLTASRSTWYSIEVEDQAGRKAYSDPIWIDVVADPPTAQ